jgi:putative membrane protein
MPVTQLRALAMAGALSLAATRPAAAHGRLVAPGDAWAAWSFDAYVVLPMIMALLLYARGITVVWDRAGVGHGVREWRAWCFAGGMAALAIALVSPLDALGGTLFTAHMTQHVLLMGVAAPLLVLGTPLVAFMWALPQPLREAVGRVMARRGVRAGWRVITAPAIAWLLHAAAIWIWHAPQLYAAAVSSAVVHAAQHASFMGTAVLFWWVLRDRAAHGLAVLYLFTTAVHSSILGALLAFAPSAWYAPYEATAPVWGLTALEDQQIGGFIMWVPAGLVYFGAALVVLGMWLQRSDRRLQQYGLQPGRLTLLLPFALLVACGRGEGESRRIVAGGDPARGRAALEAYGCGSCHEIRGINGGRGRVGPSLERIGNRVYIAGYLPNEPETLVRWIMSPRAFRNPTAMPDLGVTEQQARDIAAYLYAR